MAKNKRHPTGPYNTATLQMRSDPTKNMRLQKPKRKRQKGGRDKSMRAARHETKPKNTAQNTDTAGQKAIIEACEVGNLNFILSSSLLAEALVGHQKATGMVLELLVRHARLHEAAALLASPGVFTSIEVLIQVLLAMPQLYRVDEQDAVDLVANGVAGRSAFAEGQLTSIVLEFLAEAASALEGMRAPLETRVRSGSAVVGRIRPGVRPGELMVERAASSYTSNDRRGLQSGDCVAVESKVGPSSGGSEKACIFEAELTVGAPLEGYPLVLRVSSHGLPSHHASDGSVVLSKLANRVTYKRQLLAIATVLKACDRARSELIGGVELQDLRGDRDIKLKIPSPVIAGALTARSNGATPDTLAWLSSTIVSPTAAGCLPSLGLELNPSQRAAAEAGSSQALTLIQGPPGTGKTAVALSILVAWVRSGCLGREQALATSDSNVAVDNLLTALAAVGVRVVRLGRPESIRPELLKYCPDAMERGGDRAANFAAREEAIRSAQVVCCTCIGAGSDLLRGLRFPAVVIDEATQATEAAALVSLCRGAMQCVLLGDQCQLPPTVQACHPAAALPSRSLFDRLLADGASAFLLDTQYRMHPALAEFPADAFYGGRLSSGVASKDRLPCKGFSWPRHGWPVALLPVLHGCETDDGLSKLNRAEATAVASVVAGLQAAGLRASDIAVISPYASQVRLLRSMLRVHAGEDSRDRGHSGTVEVATVDGFQGREKEVVVFSCVRASASGGLGFLADARRVNVAMTRGKTGLIVIGHPPTLERERGTWAPWLSWARFHGLVVGEHASGQYSAEATRLASAGLMSACNHFPRSAARSSQYAAPSATPSASSASALLDDRTSGCHRRTALGVGNRAGRTHSRTRSRSRSRSRSRRRSRRSRSRSRSPRRRRTRSRRSRSRTRSHTRSRSRSRDRPRCASHSLSFEAPCLNRSLITKEIQVRQLELKPQSLP
jgi:hypothetical protein